MLKDIQFSVPLWPGLNPREIERDVYPFLEECHSVISDLYFTCRIGPFQQDAMGGIIVPEENSTVIGNAFQIGAQFEIPISPTFNNIMVSPSYANYKKFVEAFQPLYDDGVSVITIPHTSWLGFGLKDRFPGLIVKNTVLHRVQTAAECAKLFEAGFDYINLDRVLMRDQATLKEVRAMKEVMQARLGRPLFVSLLYNEMCEGHCPVHEDHYAYNLNRTVKDKAYFHSEMSDVSPCVTKDDTSALWLLKTSAVPSYYGHLDWLSQYVDTFKMHGRENKSVFYSTMQLIRSFVRGELIEDQFRDNLSLLDDADRRVWLRTIRNCKFNCWKCTACEDAAEKIEQRKPR